MTDTMTATKTCKQCGEALPLTAFGTKQARCKQCINALRAGKATLFQATEHITRAQTNKQNEVATRILANLGETVTADIAMEIAMDDECPATDTQKFYVKGKFDRAVKDMSADEKLEYTLARAEAAQKSCTAGHLMVGDNVSKAYARRGALRCRDCVNAESRANKAKNRGA